MKRESQLLKAQKALSLGLELPPEERAKLAQDLLRSAGLERPAKAGEVAERTSSYGEFSASSAASVLGTFLPQSVWGADRAFREEADQEAVNLEEVYREARHRSNERSVARAVAQAESALKALKVGPKVVRLEVELGQDQNGKEVASVVVVLQDLPRGRLYSWNQLKPIHSLIWQAFNESAEGGPWPFVNFEQESEQYIPDDDDGEAIAV